MKQQERNFNDPITIRTSVTPDRDYSGGNSVYFKVITSSWEELPQLLISHNFSLIHWTESDNNKGEYNRYRKGDNFESASGIIVDFDNTLTIDAAKQRLKKLGLNYFLITSKSHGIKGNRFHVLIPFDQQIKSSEEYRQIVKYVRKKYFSEGDPAVDDLARFFYGSPDNALWYKNVSGNPLNTGEILSITNWELTPDYSIRTADNNETDLAEIKDKVPCFCPHPDHEDKNPSAFVDIKEGRHYVHCSSCDWSWWEKDNTQYLESLCEPFYLNGKAILELGIINDQFFLEEISRDTFYRIVKASSSEEKERAMTLLVDNKRIRHISGIEMLGDISAKNTDYSVDLNSGTIRVHIKAISTNVQDNKLIEQYLDTTFGSYKDFIKNYLAVLAFTNYKRLPFLILFGKRGSGKTVFAEMVGSIYPALTTFWTGDADTFSYEVENKVLIVEENIIDKKSQYNTLKKYGGQTEVVLHKKYRDPIKVKNNMNVILLSNDRIPMFVEKDELPNSERNNQLFVWECPLVRKIDPGMLEKLKARLGHYIRTELKQAFDKLDLSRSRYSIKVPITDKERDLFANNVTNIEDDANRLQDSLLSRYASPNGADCPIQQLLFDGYLPIKLIRDHNSSKTHNNMLVKNLIKRGLITNAVSIKKKRSVNGVSFRGQCYKISSEWKEQFDEND